MNLGTGWVIIEESFHSTEKRLVSIISARKCQKYVRDFMEQTYVDKFASINEKLSYKKNRKQSPFKIEKYEQTGTTISCGHDPMFRAYYCHQLKLIGNIRIFKCRIFKGDLKQRVSTDHEGEIEVA